VIGLGVPFRGQGALVVPNEERYGPSCPRQSVAPARQGRHVWQDRGQYLGFQKVVLALVVLAFLVRLALSLSGTPNASAKWISVTAVLLLGVVYYGVAVHTRGFGSYKQLYPLVLFQSLLGEGLVALAVALAILTGTDNIYTAPEYSGGGDGKNWLHVVAHLVIAVVVLPLVSWGVSSLVMLVTKKVGPGPSGEPPRGRA
jgi:hypothetical protein